MLLVNLVKTLTIQLFTSHYTLLSTHFLRAVFLSSTQTNDDIQAVIQELSSYAYTTYNINTDESRIKMLYITPEKYSKSEQLNRLLLKLANSRMLSRFVIDEAHCLSQVRLLCNDLLCVVLFAEC